MKIIFIFFALSTTLWATPLDRTIQRAQQNVLNEVQEGRFWNFPANLGTMYVSQYYLMLSWFQRSSPLLDPNRLEKLLTETQLADGSWYAVRDANLTTGDINATLYNYWALKVMRRGEDNDVLRRARAYLIRRGGIEQVTLLTKIFLALFGNYSWREIKSVPWVLFDEDFIINERNFAQWVSPHLMPIAYFTSHPVHHSPAPAFRLDELRNRPSRSNRPSPPPSLFRNAPVPSVDWLMRKLLSRQQPRGSWGGYTLATILSIAALECSRNQVSIPRHQIDQAIERGFHFVETLYFRSGTSAYLGVTNDGRLWDTALALTALKESGAQDPRLEQSGDFIVENQQANGGIPFGEDFWYAPDTDDTAISILGLTGDPRWERPVQKAIRWLVDMQNNDGGWGAFDRNNNPQPIIAAAVKHFTDSVDLFDDSAVDVAGHILEALASQGLSRENSHTVREAENYLRRSQEPSGAWLGRWGVNYLYGTGAAIVGLIQAGVPHQDPSIERGIRWLLSRQNADGGFGESTRSYREPQWAGVGISTPTQTAWVLLALVAAKRHELRETRSAVEYLIRAFEVHGQWRDDSLVGTGHPGIVYMEYPSYPYAFPLWALARYRRVIGK